MHTKMCSNVIDLTCVKRRKQWQICRRKKTNNLETGRDTVATEMREMSRVNSVEIV